MNINDIYATQLYRSLTNDKIVKEGRKIYFYNESNGMWENDKEQFFRSITSVKDKLIFVDRSGKTDKIYNYGGYVDNIMKVYRCLQRILPKDNFISRKKFTSEGKILFDDGIYDTYNKTFTEGFDHNIVFLGKFHSKFNINLVPQ